jgi:hypothetical protein
MSSDDDDFPMSLPRPYLASSAAASSSTDLQGSQINGVPPVSAESVAAPGPSIPAPNQLPQQGPLIVVAFVAVPLGRWSALFGRDLVGSDSRKFLDSSTVIGKHMLRQFGIRATLIDSDTIDVASIVGFGLVRSWCLVQKYPLAQHSRCMIHALAALHRKSLILNFIQHEVLEGALLDLPVACGIGWEDLPGNAIIGQDLLGTLSQLTCHRWTRTVGGQHVELQRTLQLGEVIRVWRRMHTVGKGVYYWPVWTPVAFALSLGLWSSDMSPIVQRDCGREWTPPVMPIRSVLRKIKVTQQFVIPVRNSIDCQVI